jgi:hypothetical protein
MISHAQRRILLEEIAYLRVERDRYRLDAADRDLSYSAQLKGRLRADGCTRAIRSIRNIWDGLEGIARREAEDQIKAQDWMGDLLGRRP